MGEHPYRTPHVDPSAEESRDRPRPSINGRIVQFVVFAIGLLAMIIGLADPECVVELTVGGFLVVAVLRDLARSRRRADAGSSGR